MKMRFNLFSHSVFLAMFLRCSAGLCGEIHDAARAGDFEKMRELIESDPRLISVKDEIGQTPLHIAAHVAAPKGRKDMVEFLLAKGANVNVFDKEGNSPLLSAIHKDWVYKDLIALLLSNGADVNVRNENGMTPLLITASMRQKTLMEMLLAKGANVNAKGGHGFTALHSAAALGNLEIVEILLANKADINCRNDDGETPLHNAAANGLKAMVELLLNKGAAVNEKNRFGQAPLKAATHHPPWPAREYEAVAELLRQHGGSE